MALATAEQVVAIRRLVQSQAFARQSLSARLVALVRALFGSFDGWYETDRIAELSARVVGYVEASQRQSAGVTDAYLTRVLTEQLGRPVAPAGVIDVSTLRAGTTHQRVYGRPADQFRFDVSQGKDPAQAQHDAVERAVRLAEDDLALADRGQAQRSLARARVTHYRRVIHPEVGPHNPCGLCVVAADRVYNVGTLMPLHARCFCTVTGVVGSNDPGLDLNQEDLAAIYRGAGGSTQREALKNIRVTVSTHGEVGPVLRYGDQGFRGPRKVAADTTHVH